MESIKSPFSIRLIYWITNLALILLSITFLATIVFNVLMYTDFFGDDMQLRVELPVEVDFLETGNLYLNDDTIKVELVEARTRIHFIDTPMFIAKKAGIAILAVISLIFYITWIFRGFMQNVKSGNVFSIENISRLKQLSYGILGFWIFYVVYMRLAYYYIVARLEFEQVRITDTISNHSEILFIALFVWVLAHIFISGLKLQEEQDLTI